MVAEAMSCSKSSLVRDERFRVQRLHEAEEMEREQVEGLRVIAQDRDDRAGRSRPVHGRRL